MGRREKNIVGLDIGSSRVCTLITAVRESGLEPIGLGVADSKGLKKGGIVNLEAQVRSFRVIVNSVGGKVEEIVTVPANGTIHRPVPQPVEGDLSIYFEPLTGTGRWHGYAASVDNRTGDGWTMVAIQPKVDIVY